MKTLATIFPKINIGLVLILILFLPIQISAQKQVKPKELFKMPLEELMDIKVVTTVTKHEQTVEEAPAIVTVITDEQIKNRGYRSIVELLKDVLGIDIIDNVARVEIGMRGINNKSDYGKHILFLLDGHDMGWKQFKRNRIYASIVNINDIKRVEIIRGPGSALWGDNATLGIINVITRSVEDIDGVEIMAGMGSYHTNFQNVTVGKTLDSGLKIHFSSSRYEDNTSRGRCFKEYSQILGYEVYPPNQRQEDYNLYGKISYGNFALTTYKSRFDVYWPMATWGLMSDDTRLVLDKVFARLDYSHSYGALLEGKFSVTYDNYKYGPGSQYEGYPGYEGTPDSLLPELKYKRFVRKMVAEDDFIESELQVSYRPFDRLRLITGVEYEYLEALRWHYPYKKDGTLDTKWVETPPKFTTDSWAAYLHGEYRPLKNLDITAGVRHDKHSIYGGVANPRLGIVINPIPDLNVKALYGRAYYGPSIHEMNYVKKNSSYGNPELRPEIIETYEIGLGYKWKRMVFLNLSLFQNTLKDIIAYQMREPDEIVGDWGDDAPTKASNQYANIGKAKVRGVETELKVFPSKNLAFSIYTAYQEPENVIDGSRLENTCRFKAGGDMNVFLFNRLNVNLNMRYLGDRIATREKDRKNPPYPTLFMDLNRKTEPYLLANITLRTSDLFLKDTEFRLSINNLFDVEYYDPGRVENYPQLGRYFMISLIFKVF